MKIFLTTVFTVSLLVSFGLGESVALSHENGFVQKGLTKDAGLKGLDRLVQSNLWNPDYSGNKGRSNQGGNSGFGTGNSGNSNSGNSGNSQLWNPDFRSNEIQRHNNMDERQKVRQQVYDQIYADPKGSSSNNQGTQQNHQGNSNPMDDLNNLLNQMNQGR